MSVTKVPLCVDCDGTLVNTDLLHESVLLLIKKSWFSIFLLPVWLLRGKAHLKHRISQRVSLDASTLPYNDEVVAVTRQARADGRLTVLATASTRGQAEAVAAHLGLFDQIVSSDDNVNLAGANKASRLEQLFGRGGFVYAGNSHVDLPVWASSGGAIIVSASHELHEAAAKLAPVLLTIVPVKATLKTYARAMRLHQWMKNLLVFIPVISAHQFSNLQAVRFACMAFLAFGLCASAVYIINDLLDLSSDRVHSRKRTRPFAAGALPVVNGVLMVPCLLAAAGLVCLSLPPAFAGALLAYFMTTCLYSFWLKNLVIVDVLLLASLYTSRIVAGAAATAIVPSFWLLAFSMFMFLSLAIVKRYSEMVAVQRRNMDMAPGRGYLVSDLPVLMSLGGAAGYNAVLILALYVNSPEVTVLYSNPWVLWLILPPLLYWISRTWMKGHRGELHDDPVVFAATDKQSWVIAACIGFVLWIASRH